MKAPLEGDGVMERWGRGCPIMEDSASQPVRPGQVSGCDYGEHVIEAGVRQGIAKNDDPNQNFHDFNHFDTPSTNMENGKHGAVESFRWGMAGTPSAALISGVNPRA